ncbi:MAG: alpha/beta hydrolase [Pseudomonadales bacterium]|uniref:Esterase/lipase n=1 Tax=Oleiphilus messinensis TaxID=141451 RepID=A0A1Y0IF95_9GAMM|nr:alpha/beta hydrolase [Oleiphilus messinensis]ARU58920.1 esterase/lipase [Oleiphilus messinensis]MCG8613870.1 alpha/beta hydrolase [Pseudomonadales bacterium]
MNMAMQMFRSKNTVLGLLTPTSTAIRARDLFLTPRKHPLRDWEEVKEAQGRREILDSGISVIHWRPTDEPSEKVAKPAPKILLVHGWESRATQLAGFVDPLLHKGFEVYAMDAPAHGHSIGKQANPVMFARAIKAVVEHLGPFNGIVGHSMGGSALGIALSEGLNCNKAVLISSPSSIVSVLHRFAGFIGLPKGATRRFIQLIEEQVGVPASDLDIAERVRTSSTKALIIHDTEDREVPFQDSKLIYKNWSDATFVSTTGFGHRAIVRQPEVWENVARFFAE